MAISPVAHDAGGVEVWHEERGHGGTLPWSAVRFGLRPDGREYDRAVLVLPCPVGCGGETAHPGGESAPALVREVLAELATRVPEGPRPPTQAEQDSDATRDLVVTAAQSAVGVNLTALTAGQRNALLAILLHKAGALTPTGEVRPLSVWAR